MIGVFEARGLLVDVETRLGVIEGSGEDFIVGVGDKVTPASLFDGKPDPIKRKSTHVNSTSATMLKKIPRTDGRSFNMKRVSRPKILASAKCAAKTSTPCGKTPCKPEPRPKPPALTGR
jgi:hypothetical protein